MSDGVDQDVIWRRNSVFLQSGSVVIIMGSP